MFPSSSLSLKNINLRWELLKTSDFFTVFYSDNLTPVILTLSTNSKTAVISLGGNYKCSKLSFVKKRTKQFTKSFVLLWCLASLEFFWLFGWCATPGLGGLSWCIYGLCSLYFWSFKAKISNFLNSYSLSTYKDITSSC